MSQPAQPNADRIEQLIALTERLTQLLTEQAQAFEARRPHDAARNMKETSQLANVYRHEAQRVRSDPQALANISTAQRNRLIRATDGFDATIARQGRALSAAKTVAEGLVHAIAHEVAAQRSAGAPYGRGGAKSAAGSATAVTLNQRA